MPQAALAAELLFEYSSGEFGHPHVVFGRLDADGELLSPDAHD
jgi:hypothetical protein